MIKQHRITEAQPNNNNNDNNNNNNNELWWTTIHAHIHTSGQFRVSDQPNPLMSLFWGLWEETRVHEENPPTQREHETWKDWQNKIPTFATVSSTFELLLFLMRERTTDLFKDVT